MKKASFSMNIKAKEKTLKTSFEEGRFLEFGYLFIWLCLEVWKKMDQIW